MAEGRVLPAVRFLAKVASTELTGNGVKVGLAVALRASGWTQEEIARELTVGQSTVQRWLAKVKEFTDERGSEQVLGASLAIYRARGSWDHD